MKVVGGSYYEHVVVPGCDDFAGSGLRAAAALQTDACELVTAVDATSEEIASTTCTTLGVSATVVRRDLAVGFRYMTPMSAPTLQGQAAVLQSPLTADDDLVVVYGMVEQGSHSVRGKRVVIDPQRPRGLHRLGSDGITADELVVVGNAREISALADGETDLIAAAHRVADHTRAVAVIVKDGARGCLAVDHITETVTRVGPYPTRSVWPLGSGDVFTAGFSHAWHNGADVAEAAAVGSASAAWWCATKVFAIPSDILQGADPSTVHPSIGSSLCASTKPCSVYLAAPFFTVAQRWLVETCRNAMSGMGTTIFSPVHDVGPGADEVAESDLEGLRNSDAVFAIIDGWDPGTLFEIGWARRHGLPVVGLIQDIDNEGTKMLVGSGAELHQDLSSALYRAAWAGYGEPVVPARMKAESR